MRGMRRQRLGMQGIELKCRKSGPKYENAGNQGGNVRNQNRNLRIAVEMT